MFISMAFIVVNIVSETFVVIFRKLFKLAMSKPSFLMKLIVD